MSATESHDCAGTDHNNRQIRALRSTTPVAAGERLRRPRVDLSQTCPFLTQTYPSLSQTISKPEYYYIYL